MYVLWVTIDVKPEHRDAFVRAMSDHARRARANEPGTVRFDVITDEAEPNRVYFYEVYRDKAAFEAHGKAESIATFRAETQGWSNSTTVSRGVTAFPLDNDGYWS